MATPRKNKEDLLQRGRPCEFSEEIAKRICHLTATHTCGYTRLMTMYPDLPTLQTMAAWRVRIPEFSLQYFEAKNHQALLLAEETLDICDAVSEFGDKDGVSRVDAGILGKAKLQVATRHWHASKLHPKIYGDKKELQDTKEENERIKQELFDLRVKLNEKNKAEY